MRILVVEDCPINRFFLEKALRNLGHEVAIATNGREAVDWMQGEHADIVLMDITMPIMNGLDASRAIRKGNGKGPCTTPIIAVTAGAFDSDHEKCREAGINDILVKPVIVEDLKKIITRYTPTGPAN